MKKLLESNLFTAEEYADLENTDYLNPEYEFNDTEEDDVSAADVFKKLNEIWKALVNI